MKSTLSSSGDVDQSAKARAPLAANLSDEASSTMKAFSEVRVKHSKMQELLDDLVPLLTAHTETNIVAVIGATGVGKSTLTRILLKSLFANYAKVYEGEQSSIPLIAVEVRADGDAQPSF